MAEKHSAKPLDTTRLVADLNRKVQEIINGTGFGKASIEINVQDHVPRVVSVASVETEKI